jgi:hypothetical protein
MLLSGAGAGLAKFAYNKINSMDVSMNTRSILSGMSIMAVSPILGAILGTIPGFEYAAFVNTDPSAGFGIGLMVIGGFAYGMLAGFYAGFGIISLLVFRRLYFVYRYSDEQYMNGYYEKEAHKFVNGGNLPFILPYSTTDFNIVKRIAEEAVDISPDIIYRVNPDVLDTDLVVSAIRHRNGIFRIRNNDDTPMATSQKMSNILVNEMPIFIEYVPGKYQTSELVNKALQCNLLKYPSMHIRTLNVPMKIFINKCIEDNVPFQLHSDIFNVVMSYFKENPEILNLVAETCVTYKQFETAFNKKIYIDRKDFDRYSAFTEIIIDESKVSIANNLIEVTEVHPDTMIKINCGRFFMNHQQDAKLLNY